MEWRRCLRILALVAIGALIVYLVWPKYTFYYRFESQSFVSRPEIWRANTITGKVEYNNPSTTGWENY